MKKRIVSIILAAAVLLTLTACGSSGKSTGGSPSDAVTVNPAGPTLSAGSAATPEPTPEPDYRLSKVLSAGQTIWFELEKPGKGKDANVDTIYVFEPDGTVIYGFPYHEGMKHYTLGELEKMEDAEIIALARANYQERMTAAINFIIMNTDELGFLSNLCTGIYAMTRSRVPTEAELLGTLRDYWYEGQPIVDTMAQAVSEAMEQYWPEFAATYAAVLDGGEDLQSALFGYAMYGASTYNSLAEYLNGRKEETDTVQAAYDALLNLSQALRNAMLDVDPELVEARNNIRPIQYKLAITTDSTGNNTKSMVLAFYNPNPGLDSQISSKTVSPLTIDGVQVYDSYYSGYQLAYSCLLCRTDRNVFFQLDGLGDSDLPVDMSAEDLFG